jgi:hypothetical protein
MSTLRDLSRDDMAQRLDDWMGDAATVGEVPANYLEQMLVAATNEPQSSPDGPDAWGRRRLRRTVSGVVLARAAAAVLVVGGLVVAVAMVIERSDSPSTNTIPPVPTAAPPDTTAKPFDGDRAGLLRTGPYVAVTVRPVTEPGRSGFDVFTQPTDADERLVRQIDNSELPDGWTLGGFGKVSSTGWLALTASGAGGGWVFVDLLSPDRPLRLVNGIGITDGGRWGPTDLFALSLNGGRPAVIDPATGEVREVPNAKFPGGSPDIIWSADGDGFLASEGGSFAGMSEVDGSTDNIQPRIWRLTPLDGSADRPDVPELDPFGTTRYVAAGGSWLTVGACQSVLDLCVPNGQLMDGTYQNRVVVADAAGNSTTWYDNDVEGARLMQSSFAADGRSIWLLLQRTGASGPELVLARATAPRKVEIVGTLPSVDPLPDVALANGGFEVRYLALLWLSPDDALAVISTSRIEDGKSQSAQYLIRTDGSGLSVPIEDNVAGFLPTSVVDLLPS